MTASKSFPSEGQSLNSFPSIPRVIHLTMGPDTDNDVVITTTGTYDVLNVAAGTIIHAVASRVETAFTASVTETLGDSFDVDGFFTDTAVAPLTTDVAGLGLINTLVSGGAYAGGKHYTEAGVIQAVMGGATAAVGKQHLFITCSLAGLE